MKNILRLGLLALTNFAFQIHASNSKPNIIFILADDLGFGDIQANNPASKLSTPHLNQMVKDGMTFTDTHSNSAVCTPTRYGILTGRYCWRTSLKKGVLNGFGSALMDPDRKTVADLLQQNGYQTACIGKWHLGLDMAKKSDKKNDIDYSKEVKNTPLAYGFDVSFILPGSLNMAPYTYVDGNQFTEAATLNQPRTPFNISIISGGPKAPSFDFESVTDLFTEKAEKFMDEATKNDRPFFLYLPLTSPHKPVIPNKHFKGKSEYGIYGDFILQTDDIVGRINKKLKDLNIKENTLLILTSDNGSFMHRIPEHKADHIEDFKTVGYHVKNHQPNHIYRGTKADIYEAGHRVPFLVQWPNTIQPNTKSSKTICLTDFYATCEDILSNERKGTEAEDSFSFLTLLKRASGSFSRPPVIHHSINGSFAIRDEEWKLICTSGSGGREQPKGQPWDGYQLYNLAKDPSEKQNLTSQYPEKVKELEAKLKKIMKK